LITAISNDLGYAEVFAEPLRRRGQSGDMLVAISSSGQSKNIINAVNVAIQLNMFILILLWKNKKKIFSQKLEFPNLPAINFDKLNINEAP